MFEISKVNAEKGVFEWDLEGLMPAPIAWIGSLGPTRVRLIALSFFLLALLLTFNNSFASWLFHRFPMTSSTAETLQITFKWLLAGCGLCIWTLAFLFRKPRALLLMNRPQGIFQIHERPVWRLVPEREYVYKFEDIEKIEVKSPIREPITPFGYIELRFRATDKVAPKSLAFRLLSAEQFQFFPNNLYRITGKEPIGDWSEESLPPGALAKIEIDAQPKP